MKIYVYIYILLCIIVIIRDKYNEIMIIIIKKFRFHTNARNGINGRVLSVLKARLLLLIFFYIIILSDIYILYIYTYYTILFPTYIIYIIYTYVRRVCVFVCVCVSSTLIKRQ